MAPLLWQLASRHPQRQVRWLRRRASLPLQTLTVRGDLERTTPICIFGITHTLWPAC